MHPQITCSFSALHWKPKSPSFAGHRAAGAGGRRQSCSLGWAELAGTPKAEIVLHTHPTHLSKSPEQSHSFLHPPVPRERSPGMYRRFRRERGMMDPEDREPHSPGARARENVSSTASALQVPLFRLRLRYPPDQTLSVTFPAALTARNPAPPAHGSSSSGASAA